VTNQIGRVVGGYSAGPIAEVVADLKAGGHRVLPTVDLGAYTTGGQYGSVFHNALAATARPQPVVDATALYRDLVSAEQVMPYEDFPCVISPWSDAMFCYVNDHGSAVAFPKRI